VSLSIESISASAQAATANEVQVAVMKKSSDIQKDVAEALVALVTQAPPMPAHVGTRLNVLA
jgi:hypothetical protein